MADLFTDHTWTPVLVTESDMNTYIRDAVRALRDGCGFSASKSAQSVASGSGVKLQCNTEAWDSHSYYDNATNYRFTPLIAGKYQINACAMLASVTGQCWVAILKNGSASGLINQITIGGADTPSLAVSGIVSFNGSTDYVEIFVQHVTGGNRNVDGYFSGHRIGT
jgi:hypothetical protein